MPAWASARSVTSTHIANAVSWRLRQTSPSGAVEDEAAVTSPENARSMPLTVYGRSISPPPRASSSIAGPPGCGSPRERANLSSAFPRPMSRVSPKTRYRPARYPITWVFAPDA